MPRDFNSIKNCFSRKIDKKIAFLIVIIVAVLATFLGWHFSQTIKMPEISFSEKSIKDQIIQQKFFKEMEENVQFIGLLKNINLENQTLTIFVKDAFNPLIDMSGYENKLYSFVINEETRIYKVKKPNEEEMEQFLKDKNKFKEKNVKLIELKDLQIDNEIVISMSKKEIEEKTDKFFIKRVFWFIE